MDNERMREINRALDALPQALLLTGIVFTTWLGFVAGVASAIAGS